MLRLWRIPEPCIVAFFAGLFLIHQGQLNFMSDPTPSVQLFGENLVSSLGCLYLCGSIIATIAVWLARSGVERIVIGLFILSALVSLNYLHTSYNFTSTNDMPGHRHYAFYLLRHPL